MLTELAFLTHLLTDECPVVCVLCEDDILVPVTIRLEVPFRTRISLSLMTTSLVSKHCFILRVWIINLMGGMVSHHQMSNISEENQLLT